MKAHPAELSRRYLASLQKHLQGGLWSDLEPARELGRYAMSLKLDTLDLARIHEIALVALVLPGYSKSTNDGLMGQAGIFFAEALTPIEETHRGAREANLRLNEMVKALSQRTLELAASVEDLKQEIVQRQAIEESLRSSEQTTSSLLEKSRQMQEELRYLSRQLLSAQEEERKRISRELHDVIAQTLTGINVQLASLNVGSREGVKELQSKIATTQLLVERSVEIVHRFARELRPSALDDLGLIPALQTYLKVYMENTGIRVTLTVFAGIEQANSDTRTVLYRIAQEALTNVSRHAKANHAEVVIRKTEGNICMEIIDGGQGFRVNGNNGQTEAKSNRLGLLGMRERVEMVGGTFCIESTLGTGTTVRVELSDGAEPSGH